MRRVRRIRLAGFRSYEALDLPLDGRSAALIGPNGAGKTNILDALSQMGPGRGLRGAAAVEAIKSGQSGWGVGVELGAVPEDDDPVALSLRVQGPAPLKRAVRIDGEGVPSASAFLDHLRFQWLTPAQDRLFTDSPGERRRFLDRMTMSREAAHASHAVTYEKAMRQRQAELAGRSNQSVLDPLEAQMATAGAEMAAARARTVAGLSAGYADLRTGAFPSAELSLDGPFEERAASLGGREATTALAEGLKASRYRDREAGRALFGPHRSDLLVRHREKDQPAKLCSTGEQKALLIGLVLAHAASLKDGAGVPLILLLDEVAAHLDGDRRAALADILEALNCQTFMTGTDRELFDAWGPRIERLLVKDGAVQRLDA